MPDVAGTMETNFRAETIGPEKRLTIRDAQIVEVGDDKEQKVRVLFEEDTRGLLLNKTNYKRIFAVLKSSKTEDWTGAKLTLYADPNVEMGGRIVGGLRVKDVAPAETKKGKK